MPVHLLIVESVPTRPYLGASERPRMHPYDPFTFTRRTTERIVEDLNTDACGLTGSWDGDVLVFTATEAFNGDAFMETVEPDALGRYTFEGHWPWDEWSEDLDQDEEHRAYAHGALRTDAAPDPAYSDAARAAWRRGREEAEHLRQTAPPPRPNSYMPLGTFTVAQDATVHMTLHARDLDHAYAQVADLASAEVGANVPLGNGVRLTHITCGDVNDADISASEAPDPVAPSVPRSGTPGAAALAPPADLPRTGKGRAR